MDSLPLVFICFSAASSQIIFVLYVWRHYYIIFTVLLRILLICVHVGTLQLYKKIVLGDPRMEGDKLTKIFTKLFVTLHPLHGCLIQLYI
jgi:hypothetical protein